jgi:hypothetical protein
MLTLISSEDGDWEWLFDGEKLVDEGHSIRLSDVLDYLHVPIKYRFARIDPYNLPQYITDFDFIED